MKAATKKKPTGKAVAKAPAVVTELQKVEQAISSIDKVGQGIAALKQKYGGLVADARSAEGMKSLKAARHEIRQPRYDVEGVRVAAAAPMLALKRRLDAEAKRITEELLAIENPIDAQIKAEEQRVENERQAAIEKERQRIEGINKRIDKLRDLGDFQHGETLTELRERVDTASTIVIGADFEEFQQVAKDALSASIGLLQNRRQIALDNEKEQERLRKQREEQDARDLELRKREAALVTLAVPPLSPATAEADHTLAQEPAPPRILDRPNPGEEAIVTLLSNHYNAPRRVVIGWLIDGNWEKAS